MTDQDMNRQTIAFHAEMSTADLLDASEDLVRVLEQDDLDLTPATRELLFAVDEAITAAFAGLAVR
jgi:hypothetical protein